MWCGECTSSELISLFLGHYCQAQPKSHLSWAEVAMKSDSDNTNTTNTTNTNRGSMKWAEIDSLSKFCLMNTT